MGRRLNHPVLQRLSACVVALVSHCLATVLGDFVRFYTRVMEKSAGQRLRETMDAALVATGLVGAEFTEFEVEALDAACAAADRAEQLQRVYDAELAGDARPTMLSRLSAELRHLERERLVRLAMVQLTPEPVRSPRHQRAARARWDRERKRNEARVGPRPVQAVE